MTNVYKEIERRKQLQPRKAKNNFKIKYGRKINGQ